MPQTQTRKELIENFRKSRLKMENGITYECALVERIEFNGSCVRFKLKRKLDCAGTDYLRFKSNSEKEEAFRKYGHAILVSHKYFEDRNFDPYFEHDFDEYTRKQIFVCQSKEQFERMLESVEEEKGTDPALLALIETTNELFGNIFR